MISTFLLLHVVLCFVITNVLALKAARPLIHSKLTISQNSLSGGSGYCTPHIKLNCNCPRCQTSKTNRFRAALVLRASGTNVGTGNKSKANASCKNCGGTGAVKCLNRNCNRGVDKVGGSVLERWTCKTCKGFGLVSCSCNYHFLK